MRKFTLIRNAVLASAIAVPSLLFAGNVPQYRFSTSENYYTPLTGTIPCGLDFRRVSGDAYAVFENGSMVNEAQTGKGFPIGFNFRFAGHTVDQFVPASNGVIFFGKDYVKIEAAPDLALKTGDHMGYVNMHAGFAPASGAINKGDVSYLTTGEEGNKVTTVQFANMRLSDGNEYYTSSAEFNLQIRLYQKDNRIEMAWTEVLSPETMMNIFAGIHGWDPDDGIIITGNTLKADYAVSPATSGSPNYADRRIYWETYNPTDKEIKTCFVFRPSDDEVPPQGAPTNLVVEEEGTDLNITCERAVDAAATVILVSEEPFSDANMPKDGETFGIRTFSKGNELITSFGKAKAIYYGNDDQVSVTFSGVKPATTYYVRAMSASGYPAYNRTNTADKIISAAEEAPQNVSVTPANSSITLSWESDVDVIVAMTTTPRRNPSTPFVNTADFGRPTGDSKEGDELVGGGKIVYVGAEKECTVTVPKNEQIYFALWSKDGNIVSREFTSVNGITNPTLPYEPKLENRNLFLVPDGWTTSDPASYSVQRRATEGEWAVYAFSENDRPTLESPLLPMEDDTILTFDFALETAADANMTFAGDPMKGTVPGYFGRNPGEWLEEDDGYGVFVNVGDTQLAQILEYNGDLRKDDGGNYIKGSSEFEQIRVEIPAQGKRARVSIGFQTGNNSICWLRNFKLTSTSGVEEINGSAINLVYGGKGKIFLTASENGTNVYGIDGTLVAVARGEAGQLISVDVPAGIYVVDGVKVIVK